MLLNSNGPVGSVFSPNPPPYTPVPQPRNGPCPLAATYLLWEVTFCSILTAGNRRYTQPRKVRVASVPLISPSSITWVIGGAAALPSRRQPPPLPTRQARKQSPPLLHGELPTAWRAPPEADSEKMAAVPAKVGERDGLLAP